MPKLKTKSGAKKRFRVTGSGKIKAGAAHRRHMLRRRPQKMKRQSRGSMILTDMDEKMVKSYMPYSK
jgi:large subunit ribosomal protein L35